MDYVAFARARGLGSVHVTVRYAFRNALIPVTTAAGLLFTGLLTGAVLVETVFGLPGLGTLLVAAVTGGDFTMVQGLLLIIAAWIILVNIVSTSPTCSSIRASSSRRRRADARSPRPPTRRRRDGSPAGSACAGSHPCS